MNYRKLKSEEISEVGLGTWQLGGNDWGGVNKDLAMEILAKYVDYGGNFIDTADVYGNGNSERIIGEFIRSKGSSNLKIATKLGRRSDGENGWPENFTYDYMLQHVEDSLERLQLNTIFLEQFHCIPLEELSKGKVFDYIRRIQDDGLIKYWGASVETSEEALICLEQEGIASLQIIFNLFRQHVADEIFSMAKEKNVALIIRVPLASGLLSGKFNANTKFSSNDHRNYNADGEYFNVGETFSGVEFTKGTEFAEKFKNILPKGNMAQWALRWILDHPEVSTVIPGATKIEQVGLNIESANLPNIDSATYKKLKEFYNAEILSEIRGGY